MAPPLSALPRLCCVVGLALPGLAAGVKLGHGWVPAQDPDPREIFTADVSEKKKVTDSCKYEARCAEPLNCDIDPPQPWEHMLWLTESIVGPDQMPSPRLICDQQVNYFTFARWQYQMQCFKVTELKMDFNPDPRPGMPMNPKLHEIGAISIAEELKKEEGQRHLVNFCFGQGFCGLDQNFNMMEESIESSVAACDRQFGDAWRTVTLHDNDVMTKETMDRTIALTSCAIGTYWCEANLCRDFVCRDPITEWIRKEQGLGEFANATRADASAQI